MLFVVPRLLALRCARAAGGLGLVGGVHPCLAAICRATFQLVPQQSARLLSCQRDQGTRALHRGAETETSGLYCPACCVSALFPGVRHQGKARGRRGKNRRFCSCCMPYAMSTCSPCRSLCSPFQCTVRTFNSTGRLHLSLGCSRCRFARVAAQPVEACTICGHKNT